MNSDCSASHLSDMVLDLALFPVRCQRAAHRLEEATMYRRSLPTNTSPAFRADKPGRSLFVKASLGYLLKTKQCLLHN